MAEVTQKQKQELKRFVRKLAKIRGRHTELVSVYIPADYDITKIINHLAQEQGTATNIKDKNTQKRVISALERIIRHLRTFKQTPPNGLAAFAGNKSDIEGKIDTQVWSIEPPVPLNTRIYRCDQSFQLDILMEMLETKETYGLLVMDRREATLGLLRGANIALLTTMTSGVPGKTRAGGQCLAFETSIKLADGQYVTLEEVEEGDEVLSYDFEKKVFVPSKVTKKWEVKKEKVYRVTVEEEIICSGDHLFFLEDGTTKPAEDLEVGEILMTETGMGKPIKKIIIEEKPLNMIDISVEIENFVAEGIVVHNSAQRFARLRMEAAKEFYNRIGEACNKEFLSQKHLKGLLVGGPGHTKNEFLDMGFLNNQLKEKVINTEDLSYTDETGLKELVDKSADVLAKEMIMEERKVLQKFFTMLSKEPDKISYGKDEIMKALEMGAVETLIISDFIDDEIIDEFEDKTEEYGTELVVVSTDTMEGQQLKEMGGFGAILRYAFQ